ncbi:hypothetical protein AOXY_G5 [Acipenser oxyrinchus oxyrinchus]|uniref:Uncharacterized protein n=1 Tax=Acipenser oxyrinchus oxyrinchus TaxID=40147 RepID=A0AAD8GJM6_ACIOX|nr:hypothetical protein AOXY_G5 [Acipenser oxyrinchus oxyrinchus]
MEAWITSTQDTWEESVSPSSAGTLRVCVVSCAALVGPQTAAEAGFRPVRPGWSCLAADESEDGEEDPGQDAETPGEAALQQE